MANLLESVNIDASYANMDLRGVDMRASFLWGTDFECTDLRGVDMRNSVLWEVWLCFADLRGTDMRGCEIITSNLRGALRNPDDHPIPHWCVVEGRLEWD